jgi:hypothetical protein
MYLRITLPGNKRGKNYTKALLLAFEFNFSSFSIFWGIKLAQ